MFSSKYQTQHLFDGSNIAIHEAIGTILDGSVARVDLKGGIKVYKVQNVIRVDIKVDKEDIHEG